MRIVYSDTMKFYEVQPALEAGKKITHSHLNGKFLSIEKEDANIFGKTLVLTISDHSREIGYSLDMFDLFADDWEIVEENTIDSKLLSHKKYLEEWKAEIEEIMSRKEGEEIMSRKEGTDVSMRSIKYQELYLWSIRVGVIDECLEHIKEFIGPL